MSRVANSPVVIPAGVEVTINAQDVEVKGSKGTLKRRLHNDVVAAREENLVRVALKDHCDADAKGADAFAGTERALINSMVMGVSQGFESQLVLVGVGYRAKVQGKVLALTLGLSHPVEYKFPESITIETPSPTEITIKGIDKQQVGQVAAEIRSYRPPEPYKGKGIKGRTEIIVRKETKKKK